IFSTIPKRQAVYREHLTPDFVSAFEVEKIIEPLARSDWHVMAALWTNVKISCHVLSIKRGLTGRTLDPQAFGNTLAAFRVRMLDRRREKFVEPVHRSPVQSCTESVQHRDSSSNFHENLGNLYGRCESQSVQGGRLQRLPFD